MASIPHPGEQKVLVTNIPEDSVAIEVFALQKQGKTLT